MFRPLDLIGNQLPVGNSWNTPIGPMKKQRENALSKTYIRFVCSNI